MQRIFIYSIAVGITLVVFSLVNAQNPFDVQYPVPELGNCGSQEECKNFCDNPANHIACVDWAQSNGVFSAVEAKRMKDIEQMENKPEDPIDGPGGCRSPKECDAYCRLLENLDECLNYGVQNGYTSAEEAKKAKEQADKGGPNGCKSREECDSFCRRPENVEVCMKFVVEEGKITQEEANLMIKMAKNENFGKPKEPEINKEKALQILEEKGGGPGGCKNNEECKAYCEDFSHAEECMNFAKENGLMSPEEAERVKKMMTMGGPGGCKTPQECDAFCGQEANRDTCMKFSIESGILSPEEAIMMQQQMQVINKLGDQAGPGGCRSAQECNEYCKDPSRIQECMDFAAQTGMMSKDRVQTMMQQMQQTEMMKEFFMGGTMMGPPPGMEGMPPPEGYMGPPPGYEGMIPPQGFIPPEGTMMGPPPGMEGMPPPEGMFYPEPVEGMPPPPPAEPTSYMNPLRAVGIILIPFLQIFLQ